MKYYVAIWTILAFLLPPATCTDGKVECPEKTFHISDDHCFYVERSYHEERDKRLMNDHKYAISQCENLALGDLKWHLPKVDTHEKLEKITRNLEQHHREGDRSADLSRHDHYVWLGLRRRGPINSRERVADESHWYWTRTNATMENQRHSRYFWADNEPSSDDNSSESRECAVGVVDFVKNEMKFASVPCSNWDSRVRFPVNTPSYIGLACDAQLVKEEATDFVHKWYFYLIIVLIVICPIVIAILVFVCLKRRRRRQKAMAMSGSSPAPRRRSRWPRWSRPDRKDESKIKQHKRPESSSYVKFNDDSTQGPGSNTAVSHSGSSSDPLIHSLRLPPKGKSKELSVTKNIYPSGSVVADLKSFIPASVIKLSKSVGKSSMAKKSITPSKSAYKEIEPKKAVVKAKKQAVKTKKGAVKNVKTSIKKKA